MHLKHINPFTYTRIGAPRHLLGGGSVQFWWLLRAVLQVVQLVRQPRSQPWFSASSQCRGFVESCASASRMTSSNCFRQHWAGRGGGWRWCQVAVRCSSHEPTIAKRSARRVGVRDLDLAGVERSAVSCRVALCLTFCAGTWLAPQCCHRRTGNQAP